MQPAGLKKNKYTIFCAWVLLTCFVAGQYMMYVHQHYSLQKTGISTSFSKNQPKPVATVQEKCYMCDAMHHTTMVIGQQVYFNPVIVSCYIYKVGDYNFISIALILSAGRAPPATPYFC